MDDISGPLPPGELRSRTAWVWWAIPVAAALVALRGLFAFGEIFYVRDLSGFYWPMHLGVRGLVADGGGLLWDPTLRGGRSLVSDPVAHLFFPPAAVLRLLAPATFGFDLYVALPFPIAALGFTAFLARRFSLRAASIGAVAFVLSGPVLSCGNMPNLSWSLAFLPWILWAADRLTEARSAAWFAAVAALFATQFLAGEPVVLTATAALATAFAALESETLDGLRARAVAGARIAASGLAGLLLAAPSAAMFYHAAARSHRVIEGGRNVDGVSTHPLGLLETIAPGLFGDYLGGGPAAVPFHMAFGRGEAPLLVSIFLGVGALALAAVAVATLRPKRWVVFWLVALVAAVVLALGFHTPVYRVLHDTVPLFRNFRSPSKYAVVAAAAVAALAAAGWDAVADGLARARVAAAVLFVVAGLAGLVALATALAPGAAATATASLAASVGLGPNTNAASLLLAAAGPAALRLLAVALVAAGLVWALGARRDLGPLPLAGLYLLVAVDLLSAGMQLNPTLPAAFFADPEWIAATRAHADDRVYTFGKVLAKPDGSHDADAADFNVRPPAGASYAAVNAALSAVMVPEPIPRRVREVISLDMPLLSSHEYIELATAFTYAPAEQRARFLSNAGVRYYLLNHPPAIPAERIFEMPNLAPLALYEAAPSSGRAAVVQGFVVEPDLTRRCYALFAPGFDPSAAILLGAEPPAAVGAAGAGLPASAEISGETASAVDVVARVPEGGGFLVLKDEYDPYWRAEVDGKPAPVVEADAIFRAVPLAAGEHRVRFVYRPTPFYVGLGVSLATALALLAAVVVSRRRRARV